MQRSTKINTQPERKEAQKGTEPQSQSQEALTPYLVNLAMTEPENLSPDDVVRLQGLIGNQAVARINPDNDPPGILPARR